MAYRGERVNGGRMPWNKIILALLKYIIHRGIEISSEAVLDDLVKNQDGLILNLNQYNFITMISKLELFKKNTCVYVFNSWKLFYSLSTKRLYCDLYKYRDMFL